MRRTLIAISALLAAAGLGALAASGLAGGNGAGDRLVIAPDRKPGEVAVEAVDRPPRGATSAQQPRANRGQSLQFFDTVEPLEIAPGTEEAATLECPKGYRALGAYHVTGRPGTVLDLNAPHAAWLKATQAEPGVKPSKRKWVIGVYNTTAESDRADLGVVCLNRLE